MVSPPLTPFSSSVPSIFAVTLSALEFHPTSFNVTCLMLAALTIAPG